MLHSSTTAHCQYTATEAERTRLLEIFGCTVVNEPYHYRNFLRLFLNLKNLCEKRRFIFRAHSVFPTAPNTSAHPMSSSSLLPAALQKNLQQIVDRSNQSGASIQAILLSTTEGVPLGRVVVTTAVNEEVLATIESVWAPAAKQFPVLGLEKVKQVTAMYDHGTLVHVYQGPMVRRRKGQRWCKSFFLFLTCLAF